MLLIGGFMHLAAIPSRAFRGSKLAELGMVLWRPVEDVSVPDRAADVEIQRPFDQPPCFLRRERPLPVRHVVRVGHSYRPANCVSLYIGKCWKLARSQAIYLHDRVYFERRGLASVLKWDSHLCQLAGNLRVDYMHTEPCPLIQPYLILNQLAIPFGSLGCLGSSIGASLGLLDTILEAPQLEVRHCGICAGHSYKNSGEDQVEPIETRSSNGYRKWLACGYIGMGLALDFGSLIWLCLLPYGRPPTLRLLTALAGIVLSILFIHCGVYLLLVD